MDTNSGSLRMGWMLALFDLPVTTKKQRKVAHQFRKFLLDDGYMMLQFSVYMRFCPSWERMNKHAQRLKIGAPSGGNIRVFFLTEKQWGKSISIVSKDYVEQHNGSEPEQLELSLFW